MGTKGRAGFALRMSLAALLCMTVAASAQEGEQQPSPGASSDAPGGADGGLNLNMSLDQLARQDVMVPALSTVVSTVDRTPSTVGRTPAAVFVITPEMIKRSGARNIPDVLRMAPGVDVARINAHTWAISIRGFNGRFANKLLLQIDGRIVYNPAFGGIFWEQQDVVLEDVERIEVIRGPGTTMWGSNAVNGVINIITKNSADTQGLLVQSGGGGQDQRDFNTIRYGGGNCSGLTWRLWAQQTDPAAGWSPIPGFANDAWNLHHGGFRVDYAPTEDDLFTVQGDLLNGKGGDVNLVTIPTPPFDTLVTTPETFPEGNVLLRYSHTIDDDTRWEVWGYFDQYKVTTPQFIGDKSTTWDIDIQYQFSPWEAHKVVTGAGYRSSLGDTTNTFASTFTPAVFATQWVNWFVQDTITLEEDRWYFTAGVRLEWNTFGKLQAEPTARLLFTPSDRQSVWCAISRAARMPTRNNIQQDAKFHFAPPNDPVFLNFLGNPDFQAEDLVAYELGYRAAPTDYFSWDIAAYINNYSKLGGFSAPGAPVIVPPGFVLIPIEWENNTRALSYGFEITANWQVNDAWRWFVSYSLFEVDAQGSDPFTVADIEGSSPHNQVYLKSSWDVGSNVQFDVIGRYVDRLSGLDVPSYFELDARIGWQMTDSLEVSFVGQNLLDSHHLEFASLGFPFATEVRRSWYGMLTWTY